MRARDGVGLARTSDLQRGEGLTARAFLPEPERVPSNVLKRPLKLSAMRRVKT